MAKINKKVCKECGKLTTETKCPVCSSDRLLPKYKGVLYVVNVKESNVAKKLKITTNGDYAIKY